jgi:hypothetical protein
MYIGELGVAVNYWMDRYAKQYVDILHIHIIHTHTHKSTTGWISMHTIC